MPFGMTLFEPSGFFSWLPQAFATLPSRSYSTTGGDGTATTVSGEIRPPVWKARLTVKTWSCESMQVPPTSPGTQGFGLPVVGEICVGSTGNGLGQNGSTLNRGAFAPSLATALLSGVQRPMPTANAGRRVPRYTSRHFFMCNLLSSAISFRTEASRAGPDSPVRLRSAPYSTADLHVKGGCGALL